MMDRSGSCGLSDSYSTFILLELCWSLQRLNCLCKQCKKFVKLLNIRCVLVSGGTGISEEIVSLALEEKWWTDLSFVGGVETWRGDDCLHPGSSDRHVSGEWRQVSKMSTEHLSHCILVLLAGQVTNVRRVTYVLVGCLTWTLNPRSVAFDRRRRRGDWLIFVLGDENCR